MDGINSLIDKSCILLDQQVQSMDEVIRILTERLSERFPEIASKPLMEKVITEGFHTTAMGEGCAITHARCPSMQKSLIAVMRLKPPLDLGAFDSEDVRLVFLLVGPHKSASYHLKILSRLARLLHQRPFREELFTAADAQSFLQRIREKEQ